MDHKQNNLNPEYYVQETLALHIISFLVQFLALNQCTAVKTGRSEKTLIHTGLQCLPGLGAEGNVLILAKKIVRNPY